MKLRADLIPHKDFHKGFWLNNQNCPWFFFYEAPRQYFIPKNKNFYQTLDDDLKSLVEFLHSKNIPTTPSCSGHIKKDQYYADVYDSLSNMTNKIKEDGIVLVNPESNRKFFYRNPKYTLPLKKKEFIEDLRDYQKKGVLGFVDDLNISEKLSDYLPTKKDNGITLILTKANDEKGIRNNWKTIEKILKRVI
jgi:hypothetical protein